MKSRRELLRRRQQLGEMQEIMNSMKALAYMETRKLAVLTANLQTMLATINLSAADLVWFQPDLLPTPLSTTIVHLLVGSERGFCSNFNETLVAHLAATAVPESLVMTVGHKLNELLRQDERIVATLDGARVMEELDQVLVALVEAITTLQARHGALALHIFYHRDDAADPVLETLLPPFGNSLTQASRSSMLAFPPLLNLTPAQCYSGLTEHYLWTALNSCLHASLLAENSRRVQHLDGAVRHLQHKASELQLQVNRQRQEAITEEIEVILLGAQVESPRYRS